MLFRPRNAWAHTLSPDLPACVSLGQDAGGGGWGSFRCDGEGGDLEQRRKEGRSDIGERGEGELDGGGRQGAVSTLRERMFFACGSSRTTAEEEWGTELVLNLFSLFLSFVPSSFYSVLVFAPPLPFLNLFPVIPKGSLSKRFHPVSSPLREQWKFSPEHRRSKLVFLYAFIKAIRYLSSEFILSSAQYEVVKVTLANFVTVWMLCSVHLHVWETSCEVLPCMSAIWALLLFGFKRLCSYSCGMHCTYCCT